MLHYETVSPGTLNLLKRLMQIPELNIFRLVGDTSLSLQLGYRISWKDFQMEKLRMKDFEKEERIRKAEELLKKKRKED
jgi:hypothetical protein